MNFFIKRRLNVVRDYCIGWTGAFVYLAIVRGVGTEELGNLKFDFLNSLLISFLLGPIMGVVSGVSEVWMEEKLYRRITIGRFLLIRLLYVFVFIILLIIAAYVIYQLLFGTNLDIISFAFDEGSYAVYFYVLTVDLFLSILRQLNLMLGQGNLLKLIMGKFYQPRGEQRIFMFLDLQSSTQLAEKLGHIEYSSLIQDCFNDLGVVIEDGAEIYQYVGDEAVLTWPIEDNEKASFINAFYRFKSEIENRAEYYKGRYGVIPFFKAGVHGGTVTVTEIGKYKKEIAYHGDPINTAARIQGKCNELNSELLISHNLKVSVEPNGYKLNSAGSILLRGKKEELELFSVSIAQ